ncbi:MAG TPA: hypothetical protein VGS12_04845 [Caulobacteraceae bacterium]|nr:hypothetical protein [Caulobacteraceae bacterium]
MKPFVPSLVAAVVLALASFSAAPACAHVHHHHHRAAGVRHHRHAAAVRRHHHRRAQVARAGRTGREKVTAVAHRRAALCDTVMVHRRWRTVCRGEKES